MNCWVTQCMNHDHKKLKSSWWFGVRGRGERSAVGGVGCRSFFSPRLELWCGRAVATGRSARRMHRFTLRPVQLLLPPCSKQWSCLISDEDQPVYFLCCVPSGEVHLPVKLVFLSPVKARLLVSVVMLILQSITTHGHGDLGVRVVHCAFTSLTPSSFISPLAL